MPFATTQMDLEIVRISKSDRERQIPYTTYMWNLKNETNKPTYKTETDSENKFRIAKGERWGKG